MLLHLQHCCINSMRMIASIIKNSDSLGALASTLCVIHCLATPLLFIAQSCSLSCCESSPMWWSSLDFLFLFISFIAVVQSSKNTINNFTRKALWISWTILFLLIVNEKFLWFPLPKMIAYVSAFTLASLNIYNLKHCQCETESCCIHNG